MKIPFRIASFIIIAITSCHWPALGNDLAAVLVQEAEYDLARIELYKDYDSSSPKNKQKILGQVAYTYQLEGNHWKAKDGYLRAIALGSISNRATFIDSLKANLCYSLLQLDEYGQAYSLLQEINAPNRNNLQKLLDIAMIERFDVEDLSLFDESEVEALKKLQSELRSPYLSGFLSALLPGAGQFYSSHPIDGLQAMLVVGAGTLFSVVSTNGYRSGELHVSIPIATISITALFHYANILSGQRTAIYRNMKLKRDFMTQMHFGFEILNLLE